MDHVNYGMLKVELPALNSVKAKLCVSLSSMSSIGSISFVTLFIRSLYSTSDYVYLLDDMLEAWKITLYNTKLSARYYI